MFTVGLYKIRFQHKNNIQRRHDKLDTYCAISLSQTGDLVSQGVAYLNPKDQFDRLMGKKIALARALDWNHNGHVKYMKEARTEIWEAFWRWVDSWSVRKSDIRICPICGKTMVLEDDCRFYVCPSTDHIAREEA